MKLRSQTAVTAIAMVAVLSLALSGCKPAGVVALVNDKPIKSEELQRQFDQIKKASPQVFEGTDGKARETEYKAKILDSLIQVELITQAAEKLGVSVPDKEVTDYMTQLETQYGGKSGLEDAMKQAGITTEQLKDSVKSRLIYDAVRNKVTKDEKVSDEDAKAYYDKNPATFSTPAQVHAAHILLEEKDKTQAEKVLADVKGGADIAALAKQYSTDPGSKDKGGDLGWAAPNSYVAEFSQAVSEMTANEVRLVHTTFGWHIIKLLETKPAEVKTFEQVREQIAGFLQQETRSEQFTAYVADLRKKAKIEILDADLKKAMEGTQTVSPTP